MIAGPPRAPLFPYATLFRSGQLERRQPARGLAQPLAARALLARQGLLRAAEQPFAGEDLALAPRLRVVGPQALHAVARPRAQEQHLARVARDGDRRRLAGAEAARGGVAVEEVEPAGVGGEDERRDTEQEREGEQAEWAHGAAV